MSLIRKNNVKPSSITHRAGWVLIDPDNIVKDGFVKTESGKIVDVGQGRGGGVSEQFIDHGPGVLMPCMVNAHTHLELSALKNKTNTASGFINWVKSVIENRDQADEKKISDGFLAGIDALINSGSLVIGDIASTGLSEKPFLNSKISGVQFKEFLGSNTSNDVACKKLNTDKSLSLAGHAPHTTTSDLLIKLKSITRKNGFPFSLHLTESEDEVVFLTTGKGAWADFLNQRGIDVSGMKLTGAGPVEYADQLGLLDEKTLAVHLVFADKKDFHILSEKKVNVCLCPRSNMFLHKHLPDVPLMLKSGLKLCLGTDSLASNDSLSLFDEMTFLSQSFADISPEDIIAMATVNGAAALGFKNQFGSLIPGQNAKMIYVPIKASNPKSILESIVSSDFEEKISVIF